MQKMLLITLLAFNLSACMEVSPIPQPQAGYQTIRFRSAISVRDHAFNLYHFGAGSVFVADRTTSYGLVYCGQGVINDDARLMMICIGYKDPSTIIIGPGAGIKEVERSIPAGVIERTRTKL